MSIAPGWRRVRLKQLIDRIDSGVSVNAVDIPRAGNEIGILKTSCVSTGLFNPEQNKTVHPEEHHRVACPVIAGSLIVSRMNTPQLVGAAGLVRDDVDNLYLPDRLWQVNVNSDVCAAFISYWMRTRAYLDQVSSAGVGTSASMQNISQGDFRNLVLTVPTSETQRAIADYLDRETARIDTLIAEQQRLIDLLEERRESVADLTLARHGFEVPTRFEDYDHSLPAGWRVILLGRTLEQLTNGFVGPTRDILVDQGIRYIQGTHIKAGRIDFDRRPFYVSRDWYEERPRIQLGAGDVLIVQTGDIGKVAVVPPGFGEASCHALQIARTDPEILSGEYLAAFLSSRLGYQSLIARATGALHPHLEAGIRSAPIILPPLEIQNRIVDEVAEQIAKIETLIAETEKFIELSRERRTALITAAVTGEIDVRGEAA